MDLENPAPIIYEKNAKIYSTQNFKRRKDRENDEDLEDQFDEFESY